MMNEPKIQHLRAAVLKDLSEFIPKSHYAFVQTQQDIAEQDFVLAKLIISSHYRNPQLSPRQLTAASVLEKIGLYCSECESTEFKSDVSEAGITPEFIKNQEQENLCFAVEEYRGFLPEKEAKMFSTFFQVKNEKNNPSRAPIAQQQEDAILAKLVAMRYNPIQLPKPEKNGLAGVRSIVFKEINKTPNHLFPSKNVFDTAWQRLRDSEKIKDE